MVGIIVLILLITILYAIKDVNINSIRYCDIVFIYRNGFRLGERQILFIARRQEERGVVGRQSDGGDADRGFVRRGGSIFIQRECGARRAQREQGGKRDSRALSYYHVSIITRARKKFKPFPKNPRRREKNNKREG